MASLAAPSLVRSVILGHPTSFPSVSRTQDFPGFKGLKACSVLQLKASRQAAVILRPSHVLQVSCAASPETLSRVVKIVTNQLATTPDAVQPYSKFSDLGADSLDQVEIVMALEEEFDITVDEDGAESIVTVQDAADLIQSIKGASKAAA